MRNNQNLPNRRIDSNNVNGRQLPSTSPVYNSSRSRTPYRPQSRNNYINMSNYQRNSDSNNKYNNRNTSYNRNNFNRSRTNSYNRNNNYKRYNKSRSSSRYTNYNNNKYNNNNNKGRINNIETDRQKEDPPGIDEYEYTSELSNEDQEILDKFYNANEDRCNTIVNALESNPTWILPMYQCQKFELDFTKQKPVLEIDFLLDSGAILNLLNEDTWNEIKCNNSDIHLERANKTLTAANNTTIETF